MHIKDKLISAAIFAGVAACAAPALATCGVGGYWGSECGPQPSSPTNTATGGNATAGAVGVGVGVGHGGSASVGDTRATSGSTSTATGGSVTNSGNSSSAATGGQGGSAVAGVTGSGNSSARSGSSVDGSGNSSVNVRNGTRIKHAASTAIAPQLDGYGMANCFGDSSPSGSFTAAMQTFGWGVSAGSTKASNVCAIYQIGGERAALAYLAAMDPNAHRALIAAGLVTTPSRVQPAAPAQTVRCPEGSAWDGKGCWMPRKKSR